MIVNEASPVSRAIGEAYRRARGVPSDQVLSLRVPVDDPTLRTSDHETISRDAYLRLVREPLVQYLAVGNRLARIEVLVTTKGVPLFVRDDEPLPYHEQRSAAVDAELAVLGSRLENSPGRAGSVNPYFRSDLPFAAWRARHPNAPLRFIVGRLTGYATPAADDSGLPRDVAALIERARSPRLSGRWLLDADPGQRSGRGAANDALFAATAARLQALGLDVEHDRSVAFRSGLEGLMGLVSWGSNASEKPGPPFFGKIHGSLYPGTFAPGAIAVNLVSTNGRTFTDGAPYGQSLAADLIRLGVSGVAAHVAEPTLNGVARPRLLVDYARGAPAGEAFFRGVPFLSWMNAFVGDPLMRLDPIRPGVADGDGDGVPDRRDNCRERPNPRQRDSDGDGWGNLCDGDLDGNGRIDLADAGALQRALRTGRHRPAFDLDEDGEVGESDLDRLLLDIHLPPGPGAVGAASRRPETAQPSR